MSENETNSNHANSPADPKRAVLKDQDSADTGKDRSKDPQAESGEPRPARRRLKIFGTILVVLAMLAVVAFFATRHYVNTAIDDNLPKLDGSLRAYGLAEPVTVTRDDR